MERSDPTWIKILRVFAYRGHFPGLTIGEIEQSARLHPGTAAHQRMTLDVEERHGWKILRCKRDGRPVYWMPSKERERARRFLCNRAQMRRAA